MMIVNKTTCLDGRAPRGVGRLRHGATARSLALVLLALFVCQAPAEIYKYRNAEGKTVFTDSPPADVEKVEEIEPTINTAIPAPAKPGGGLSEKELKEAERKRKREALSERIGARITLRKELRAEVDAARKRLKALEEERELSAEPRPGEMQYSIINQNARPKESYFKRIAEMDEKIEQAKKELAMARKNLRDMKRHPVEEAE